MSGGIHRRRILELAVTAAGMTFMGTSPNPVLEARAASGDRPRRLIDAAREDYRRSLARLRRTVPRADVKEVEEQGTGSLASDPAALRASRNAREGTPDFDVLSSARDMGARCAPPAWLVIDVRE